MPKKINNIREQLLAEAKKQLRERGYEKTTVRSVAQECGIAVGTVYNYFKSKDILIASLVLEDWNEFIRVVSDHPKEDKRAYLEFIHTSLRIFAKSYDRLFTDKEAAKTYNTVFLDRHKLLRTQLAQLIGFIAVDEFCAEFVAEAMLCWTMAGKSFDDIYNLLPKEIK